MAEENKGLPNRKTLILESGDEIVVDKFDTAGLCAVIGHIRDIAPDLTLADLMGMVKEDDDLKNTAVIMQALLRLAVQVPTIIPELTAAITRKGADETGKLSPRDSLKILKAALEVNNWPQLVEDYADFFGKATEQMAKVMSSLPGSRESSST